MKYIIATGQDAGDLEYQINRSLKLGWELYGNPFSTKNYPFCQAMVKKEASE